jgi:hypothetical protein
MKKLTKEDNEQRDSFVACLQEKSAEVAAIVEKINAIIADELSPTIAEYNGILNDADEWRNELVGRMEDYETERSEKWQEGEAGQSYTSWREAWEQLDLSELPEIEEIEAPGIDTEELEQIASQPED